MESKTDYTLLQKVVDQINSRRQSYKTILVWKKSKLVLKSW